MAIFDPVIFDPVIFDVSESAVVVEVRVDSGQAISSKPTVGSAERNF